MATTTMLSSMTVYYLLIAIIVFASCSSNVFAFTTSTPTTTAIASAKVASRSLLQPQLRQQPPPPLRLPLTPLLATSTSSSPNTDVDVVVISPPGGIGEMTSIEAARLGGAVKWFVVSAPTTATATTIPSSSKSAAASVKQVSLTAETLAAIEKAGGSLELAGASADSLLLLASQQVPASAENTNGGGSRNSNASSLAAMASWCANSNCIISTYDNGASSSNMNTNMMLMENNLNKSSMEEEEEEIAKIRAAIRLATKEAVLGIKMQPTATASGSANDTKKKKKNVMIAILPTGVEEEDIRTDKNMNNNNEPSRSGGGLFGVDLFGGAKDINDPVVPTTLMDAIGKHHDGGIVIRYGDLFGAPESSPESSPFMGGPKRDPVVRDMYTMRSVRIDPTIFSTSSSSSSSSTSSSPSGMTFKSNRLAVAEVVSQLGMGKIDRMISDTTSTTSLDITLSSFVGTEKPSDEEWNAEFGRVLSELMSYPSSIVSGGGTQQQRRLFRAEFASVPSTKRLAEWIATKWAPAVLRSYDIAGIRVGARPVYALLQSSSSTNNNDGNDFNVVEIVWQELVNFNSVTSGKMIIEVGESGIMAWRGAGDSAKGFGSISSSPLPGEDILVRRLADAASQAIEKGLAFKPQSAKKAEIVVSKKPVTTVVVDEIIDTVTPPPPTAEPMDVLSSFSSNEGPGPRSAGARRSSERSRGSRKVTSPTSPTQVDEEES